jgi:hypothetical protein
MADYCGGLRKRSIPGIYRMKKIDRALFKIRQLKEP